MHAIAANPIGEPRAPLLVGAGGALDIEVGDELRVAVPQQCARDRERERDILAILRDARGCRELAVVRLGPARPHPTRDPPSTLRANCELGGMPDLGRLRIEDDPGRIAARRSRHRHVVDRRLRREADRPAESRRRDRAASDIVDVELRVWRRDRIAADLQRFDVLVEKPSGLGHRAGTPTRDRGDVDHVERRRKANHHRARVRPEPHVDPRLRARPLVSDVAQHASEIDDDRRRADRLVVVPGVAGPAGGEPHVTVGGDHARGQPGGRGDLAGVALTHLARDRLFAVIGLDRRRGARHQGARLLALHDEVAVRRPSEQDGRSLVGLRARRQRAEGGDDRHPHLATLSGSGGRPRARARGRPPAAAALARPGEIDSIDFRQELQYVLPQ